MNSSKTLSSKLNKESSVINISHTIGGVLINDSDFYKLQSICPTLLKNLTVVHHVFIGKEKRTKSLPLYKRIAIKQKNYYLLARFTDFNKLVAGIQISKKNKIPEGDDTNIDKLKPGVDLHDYQQVAMDFLIRNVYSESKTKDGTSGCIFVMETGLGKTYIGGSFIEFCKKKTLIIIPNTSPIEEWVSMLEKNFPYLDIGQYHSKALKTDGDVVIMTIDSALNLKFTWVVKKGGKSTKISMPYYEYFQLFGAVIFDEIHNYSTAKRHEVFWRTYFKYALGLTATPDERSDGMDPVAEAHVGKIIRANEIPGFEVQDVRWTGTVRAIRYRGPPEFTKKYTNSKGWVSTKKMCDQFIEDPYRNKLLLNKIKELYDSGKNIFIFSERRQYLITLQNKLSEHNLKAEDVQTLMGGASSEEESNARTRAKIILITYGFGTESISIPKMDAIIFATPRRRKMRQTLGRILRRSGDPKITRVVIDIIDENTTLRSQFDTRKKIYEEKGFPIDESHVSFEEIA